MIRINLSEILFKRSITIEELAELTNIQASVINDYYNETVQMLSIDNLERLCRELDIDISDLIEFIPGEGKKNFTDDELTPEEEAEVEKNWQAYLKGDFRKWDDVKKELTCESEQSCCITMEKQE